ncbi:restriction endonuclease subunit S [Shewanella baltica]|nr:restriction endonuclease subunit S [Shewanella baltica]MCS6138979.1 restriction endonuclease subunit S [Shewanella baltica]MCS6145168.1 restriction endonuclease subunit S [Shewanella baltica]MCS6169698.1 restriction endonuclease subunit S [Shewanella baltica]MCS6186922.1 restriction endonuclease subunit S [Shewanella baltica]
MNKKFAAYPEYKDSGIEWVGDIPINWNVLPAFAVLREECIRNLDGAETNVLSLSYGAIKQRDVESNAGLLPESFNTYQLVNYGDIVLRLTDLQNDKRSLRVGRSTQKGIITSAYMKLVCLHQLDNRFVYQLLHSYDTTKVFYGMGGGLRQSMKFEDFRRLPVIVPPLEEQRTIAAFLDYETARIDQLIAKQQKLIELLKEKRQAVISHAVTKGLNPDVPMKDSGVEWLGQVPEHWKCSRIGWLCKVGNGMTPNRNNAEYWSEGHIPWLNSSKVNDVEVFQAEQFVTATAFAECSLPWVKVNSVIMAITGEGKTRGTTAITRIDTTINQHVAFIMPISNRIVSDFICIWLQSHYGRIRFESEGWGSTKAAITCSDIKAYPVPLPSVREQNDIVKLVKVSNLKFDNLVSKATEQVGLLRERRTALISAAVTGKIDVRGWNASNERNSV